MNKVPPLLIVFVGALCLPARKYDIKYISYNWGLNDQGPHGRSDGKANLIFDNIFN